MCLLRWQMPGGHQGGASLHEQDTHDQRTLRRTIQWCLRQHHRQACVSLSLQALPTAPAVELWKQAFVAHTKVPVGIRPVPNDVRTALTELRCAKQS